MQGDSDVHVDSDPLIEAYKRHIDRTLLRKNLLLTPSERVANLMALQQLAEEARRAGERARTTREEMNRE